MPDFLAGMTLTAGQLQLLGTRPVAYTPTLTTAGAGADPVLGTGGSAQGQWTRHGDLVYASWAVVFGTSGVSAGSGVYEVALPPVTPLILLRNGLGAGRIHDLDLTDVALIYAEIGSANTRVQLILEGGVTVQGNAPWTWAANDYLLGNIAYIGDF